jgi:hypothetical protein
MWLGRLTAKLPFIGPALTNSIIAGNVSSLGEAGVRLDRSERPNL